MSNVTSAVKGWNFKKIGIIAGIVVGVLAIIYVIFSIYFMSHFFFAQLRKKCSRYGG